jgi:hypothetical protein
MSARTCTARLFPPLRSSRRLSSVYMIVKLPLPLCKHHRWGLHVDLWQPVKLQC